MLSGGHDRRALFIRTAEESHPEQPRAKRKGRIERVRVDVPGGGP